MSNIRDNIDKCVGFVRFRAFLFPNIERTHRRRINLVRQRGHARVVFLAMSVPMWKYQRVYELMARDDRFSVTVVLSPSIAYDRDQQLSDIAALRRYFDERQVPYIDFDPDAKPFDIKHEIDPDIIFYPQPYEHLLVPQHDCPGFYDRLLCYVPYAYLNGLNKLTYNFHFHNLAWRLYYPNEQTLADATRVALNHGRNVRVSGHPGGDAFAAWQGKDVWRKIDDGRPRKRIIWAPHFSFDDKFGLVPRSNFLWMAHFMLDLAQRYSEHIQIAFKPHPRLLTELYAHPEWGKKRADAYYRMWADMPNTQLETGDYIDLFMSSDAMVHDSGSFVIEYLYTRKPVMFVSRDINQLLSGQADFARMAFKQTYIGKDEREIMDFVDGVVLGEDDPMKPQRAAFSDRYLMPHAGQTVAGFIVDDIIQSLGL